MTERKHIWPLLKQNISAAWTRIENTAVPGAPDVHGQNGTSVWIENKIFTGRKLHFRPSQPAWIMRHVAHGGRVFIIARKNDTLLLWRGSDLPELLRRGTASVDGIASPVAPPGLSVDLAVWASSKPFDWPGLQKVLFG